ncbi:MAG: HPr family phosphocarrier protein [Deltaproteobacteria bacterium]|nr:HPr family phosphocarrier protein [Deltaproteobacteria bacterium]
MPPANRSGASPRRRPAGKAASRRPLEPAAPLAALPPAPDEPSGFRDPSGRPRLSGLPQAASGAVSPCPASRTFSFESVISNRLGLHSRAAARLSQALENFDCEIYLEKGELRADAKSVLDLLSLCCPCNTKVTVLSRGPEAESALLAARSIIQDRFGEEE